MPENRIKKIASELSYYKSRDTLATKLDSNCLKRFEQDSLLIANKDKRISNMLKQQSHDSISLVMLHKANVEHKKRLDNCNKLTETLRKDRLRFRREKGWAIGAGTATTIILGGVLTAVLLIK